MRTQLFDVTVQREDGTKYTEIIHAVSSEDAMRIARERVDSRYKVIKAVVW